MGLQGGAQVRRVGPFDGTSAHVQEAQSPAQRENTGRRQLSLNQEEGSHQELNHSGTSVILEFLQNCGDKMFKLSPWSVGFCYRSLS